MLFRSNIPIRGKWFIIENNKGNEFPLQIPDKFSLYNFFDFIMDKNNFDITNHVEKIYQKDKKGKQKYHYKILENTFNTLTKIKLNN